jgi:hypothetical protein
MPAAISRPSSKGTTASPWCCGANFLAAPNRRKPVLPLYSKQHGAVHSGAALARRRRNPTGDFVLHSKDIIDFKVVSICPKLKSCHSIVETRRYAYLIVGFANAAIKNIARPKFSTGLDRVD